MPTNPEQVHTAVVEMGRRLADAGPSIQAARELAAQSLKTAARAAEDLTSAVSVVASSNPALRCARPVQEDISIGYSCPFGVSSPPLLAVDGSQALPDRHEEVVFALINVAAIIIEPGSQKAPHVSVDTRLLFGDDLQTSSGTSLTEGDLSLIRDAAERRGLLANAPEIDGLAALVDGPLELWGAKDTSNAGAYRRAMAHYVADMQELRRRRIPVAGYVDKPAADLVVRMLECWESVTGTASARAPSTLPGVTDRWLFGSVLEPGERSAVFELQSTSSAKVPSDIVIHFFYLNVGREAQQYVARVEIPRWLGSDTTSLASLHRAILDQCSILGDRPYPYVLHRAHEAARISPREKQEIKHRLMLELRRHGVEMESISPKSSAKSLRPVSARQ